MKEKMAQIVDQIQNLYPNGKGVIVFELNMSDYINTQKEFGGVKMEEQKFKVDISGTEIIFILDGLLNV